MAKCKFYYNDDCIAIAEDLNTIPRQGEEVVFGDEGPVYLVDRIHHTIDGDDNHVAIYLHQRQSEARNVQTLNWNTGGAK